jgi:hypothetical protein
MLQISPNWLPGNWTLDPHLKWALYISGNDYVLHVTNLWLHVAICAFKLTICEKLNQT